MALTFADAQASKKCGEWFMNAKYNYIIDSVIWRVGLNVAGFALWLAVAVGVLAA